MIDTKQKQELERLMRSRRLFKVSYEEKGRFWYHLRGGEFIWAEHFGEAYAIASQHLKGTKLKIRDIIQSGSKG